jgi:hypothetical protein
MEGVTSYCYPHPPRSTDHVCSKNTTCNPTEPPEKGAITPGWRYTNIQ